MHAKRFGRAHGSNAADSSRNSTSPPMNSIASRTPAPISNPKGRITIETMADVIRRIEGMAQAAKEQLCDELAADQPEALGWVLALPRHGVSTAVVDGVLHILLVISESIKETIRRPLPPITTDALEQAAATVQSMFRLLQGESEEKATELVHLMAESHPERNLLAYAVNRLSGVLEAEGHRTRSLPP
jgi:hypothetical protein